MKRLITVIVLICIIGGVFGAIISGETNRRNRAINIYSMRDDFNAKRRVILKSCTKDFCSYRQSIGNDSMLIYSLFKVKKFVDNTFKPKFDNLVRRDVISKMAY